MPVLNVLYSFHLGCITLDSIWHIWILTSVVGGLVAQAVLVCVCEHSEIPKMMCVCLCVLIYRPLADLLEGVRRFSTCESTG